MDDKKIKRIIRESIETLVGDRFKINDESKLISDHIIDSLGVIEIVSMLENKFNINIEQSELTTENLDSIVSMSNYITSKIK